MRNPSTYIAAVALLSGCSGNDARHPVEKTPAVAPMTMQPTVATRPSSAPAKESEGVHQALQNGNTSEAIALLRANPSLLESRDDLQQTPLHVAAHRGRADAVTWLLDHGAKVNAVAYNKFTPLHLAESGAIAEALI